jgi:NAD(P)-dependent dehydrogenase (short-subunit alcohol dehydrogenase family)
LPSYPWQSERFWIDALGPIADAPWRAPATGKAGAEDPRTWQFTPQWRLRPESAPGGSLERGAWLLFCDRGGRGTELAALLARAGHEVWCVNAAAAFNATRARSFDARPAERGDFAAIVAAIAERGVSLAGIVHLWNLDAPPNDADVADIEQFQVAGCASIAFLIQALVAREMERPPRIRIVTKGAQSPDGRPMALAQAPAWGLGRVIAEEHPEFWGGLLDLDPAASAEAAAAFIVQELGTAEVEDGVAQAASGRHVLRLAAFTPTPGPEVRCDPAASYLVTGGLGAVGLETARWLVERGARHLILASRSTVPPRELWATPESATWAERIESIQRLEAAGALVEAVALDSADAAAVAAFLRERAAAGRPPIRGVVHAAADTGDCLVIELDVEKLMKVMRPKLVGASLIERATRHLQLDFLILHSSLGSLLGQPGHPSYAAANAFLDALAFDAQQRGRRALAINWAAWADLGLAQSEGGRRTIGELARRGIRSFSAAAGTKALGQLLDGGAITAIVAPADWERFVAASRKTRVPSIVRDIGRYEPAQNTPDRPAARRSLDGATAAERPQMLMDLLKTELAEVLRLPESRIESEVPMGHFGLESLTALELRKRLEASLATRLSATVMWNYPTIALLSEYLLQRIYGTGGATAAATGAQQPAAPAGLATTELSEEEAIQALMGRGGSSH